MTPLIAMPGPWLPDTAAPGSGGGAELPDLPALTRLLRRAQRLADAPDWRAGVLAALGGDATVAPVAVAAAALPAVPANAALCFAAPLHVVAGISRVHLPPGGRPGFEAGEEQAFCTAFNAEFGGGEMALHVAAPGGGWLLVAPFAAAARDAPPEGLVGEPLARHPATSADERALRLLGAEAEMWLAAHPLNRARAARGQLPINALWLWGGGRAAPLPRLRRPKVIAGAGMADAWLAGLARHCGLALQEALDWPQATQGISSTAPAGDPACSALLVLAPDTHGASGHYWQMLEEHWFAPALRDVEAGMVAGLRLQVGPGAWRLPDRAWLGWLRWRRRRSWWQITGQVRA